MLKPLILIMSFAFAGIAQASDALRTAFPEGREAGQATLRWLGFEVYDARVFTQNGVRATVGEPLALELTYKRKISRDVLVDTTMDEFGRSGPAPNVRGALMACFRNVQRGDRFLAVTRGTDTLDFWLNDDQTCTLTHPDVANRFMAIFLGENTRSARFTQALRGE